jgi:hypothetical protein
MFNKRHNAASFHGGAGVSNIGNNSRQRRSASSNVLIVRNNNVDEGVVAFGLWLNNDKEQKNSSAAPITMREFHKDKAILLQDNILQKETTVNIIEGIPFCNECRSDDCVHVGFAICAEQMHRRQSEN